MRNSNIETLKKLEAALPNAGGRQVFLRAAPVF